MVMYAVKLSPFCLGEVFLIDKAKLV